MKTIILMWNPAISSYTMDHFEADIKNLDDNDFNWSIWDYKHAECGDKFFLVRCGDGNNGIVMAGTLSSDPYEDDDWSGHGRQTFYMDMDVDFMVHPDIVPIVTTSQLLDAIPGFDWRGGHSGRVLDEASTQKLEKIWAEYLHEHKDLFSFNDEKDLGAALNIGIEIK